MDLVLSLYIAGFLFGLVLIIIGTAIILKNIFSRKPQIDFWRLAIRELFLKEFSI